MRILLVDDHTLFREGLCRLITSEPDLCVAGEAGSVQEAISKAVELKPDLVLMDINLPDGSGLEAVRKILVLQPETMIIILTVYEDDKLLFDAVRAGAKGFLLKNTSVAKLLASLRAIQRGEAAISRKMTLRILDEFARLATISTTEKSVPNQLTAREMEVLRELATGASNCEIAAHLFISKNTVKIHVHNILDKLGVVNRREAERYAHRRGID